MRLRLQAVRPTGWAASGCSGHGRLTSLPLPQGRSQFQPAARLDPRVRRTVAQVRGVRSLGSEGAYAGGCVHLSPHGVAASGDHPASHPAGGVAAVADAARALDGTLAAPDVVDGGLGAAPPPKQRAAATTCASCQTQTAVDACLKVCDSCIESSMGTLEGEWVALGGPRCSSGYIRSPPPPCTTTPCLPRRHTLSNP